MKLLNFKLNGAVKLGVKTEQGILDIEKAGQEFNEDVPNSMKDLISGKGISTIRKLVDRTENNSYPSLFLNEEKIEYQPVIPNPGKIVCVGLNYLSHVEEAKTEEIPKTPVLFSKFNNSLSAHNERISLPSKGKLFDYEAELVIVIGEEAKNVEENEALSFVFGYTVGNDLSIRDLQFTSSQWLLGKSADGFAPIGPYIVPAEEVDPQNLNIECRVNGEVRQSSNTKHMIFDCATIVSYISKHMTLKPGDIIFTGTPEGVILGLPENERIWLTSGDEVEITIEGIGTLRNILE
ncbi:fumarylacetoacetate hydrolase family protein [Bacillus sp. FJAT-29814]|uniref:fumarylacetoacetate hydrolase family protein n=1 Tax=Bacillus sp. FJAT-29814 TaxID=1729688 RepID=UPI000830C424|nr:fumarylacetoacetate hydrolase family protein [Bacillus sp. FJAT-29814]